MNITYPGLFPNKILTDDEKAIYKPTYPNGWNPSVFQPKSGLGLLYVSPFEDKVRETFTHNGIEMEFVDFWPSKEDGSPFNYVRAAYTEQTGIGKFAFYLALVHLSQIDLAILKNMEVWKILSDEDKHKLETNNFVAPTISPRDEETTGTKGRKRNPEYANLPRELTCCTKHCDGKMPYISPTMLIAKAEEKGVTPEEYAKTWKCAECEPRQRGKRISAETANLPREIKCSTEGCDVILPYISPTVLVKKASDKGITVEEYIATYKCTKCEPSKRRGKVASAKWANYPKEITCVDCKVSRPQHPSMTMKLAEVLGKTFEQFISEYKCRKCNKMNPTTTTTTTTRGRKMSPDSPWFGKAKELKCACGKVQPQHASITDAQSKKAGVSFDDYVATWKCINCRPVGAKRVRNGKEPNPDFAGIPKETACISCAKVVKLVPSNIIEKAEILGLSVEDLVKNYKCRSCGGRLTKKDKKQHALNN